MDERDSLARRILHFGGIRKAMLKEALKTSRNAAVDHISNLLVLVITQHWIAPDPVLVERRIQLSAGLCVSLGRRRSMS